jgi:hypothetical protein
MPVEAGRLGRDHEDQLAARAGLLLGGSPPESSEREGEGEAEDRR